MTRIAVSEEIAERIRSTTDDVEFLDEDGNLVARLIRKKRTPNAREQSDELQAPLADLIVVPRNLE